MSSSTDGIKNYCMNELTDLDGAAITDVRNYQKFTAEKVGTYYFPKDEVLCMLHIGMYG